MKGQDAHDSALTCACASDTCTDGVKNGCKRPEIQGKLSTVHPDPLREDHH